MPAQIPQRRRFTLHPSVTNDLTYAVIQRKSLRSFVSLRSFRPHTPPSMTPPSRIPVVTFIFPFLLRGLAVGKRDSAVALLNVIRPAAIQVDGLVKETLRAEDALHDLADRALSAARF